VNLPTTTGFLLAWDAGRPRTQQAEMGMSALGSCRRQAGYHLQGYEADEGFQFSGIQAVLGSAIHQVAADAARKLAGRPAHTGHDIQATHGEAAPQILIENVEVRFGGLTGHPDLYYDGIVRDIKTLGYTMQLEDRRQRGPRQRERWQVHTYGAGLIIAGYPVRTVQLDYVARDSGQEYLHEEPFDAAVVGEAMTWLEDVRKTTAELLPRDYRPDSATCRSCPYFRRCWNAEPGTDDRHVLFIDNPDAAFWAQKLEAARAVKKRAEADEADARGALDALRSVQRPGEREEIAVPGMERVIRFRVGRGRSSPDMAKIAVDYRNAGGARPPMKQGEPVISVNLVKPKTQPGA